MSAPASPRERRWLRRLGVPLGCVVLCLVFAVWQFPWDRLAGTVASRLGEAVGADVRIASLGPGLGITGPWLVLHDASVAWPDGSKLALTRLAVRPAWAFSWFRGEPAIALDAESPAGQVRGTVWPGEAPAFAGQVADLEPAALPARWFGGQFPPVTGRVAADLEVGMGGPRGISGRVSLDVVEGALAIPDTPVAIPFDRLRGDLDIADDGSATLADAELLGPLVSIGLAGTLGPGRDLGRSALALDLDVRKVDPTFAPLLANLDLQVGPDGGRFRIEGTPASPRVRRQ